MDPPRGFASQRLVTTTLPAGGTWLRLYKSRFPDPLGWGPGLSRFSHPTGTLFGVVYLGSSLKVCFVETIVRDRADGQQGELLIPREELGLWTCAELVFHADLTLIDLCADGRLRMGVPSDVAGAKDQTLARKWSQAFWEHRDMVDGVLYPSRLNGERNLALYDRGLPKLAARAVGPLLRTKALAGVLRKLEIKLVRPASA